MIETSDQSLYLDLFERQRRHSTGPAWLASLRQRAIDSFADVGFPDPTDEEWRFTNIRPIVETRFALATRDVIELEALAPYTFARDAAAELVFVNGHFAPEFSSVPSVAGLRISGISESEDHLAHYAKPESHPFVALNTAFVRDAAVIHVPRGAVIAKPIHLIFISTASKQPTAVHPRVLISAEPSSQVQVVETYAAAGEGVYLSNAVTEIVAGDNAQVEHCVLQHESASAYHLGATHVRLGRSANLLSTVASLGGAITRNDLNVVMAGEGAQATLNGLTLISGRQHVDNHTLLDHAQPHCPSHELYKHVLAGQSSGVFKGKILVRPGAQKTDSKQTSRTLLLTDDATMNSQPALEIYADDVKCTHGSTTGPLDPEQVFYLRSRGITLEAARHLLTYAFAADVTGRIKAEPARLRLERILAAQHGLPEDIRITEL